MGRVLIKDFSIFFGLGIMRTIFRVWGNRVKDCIYTCTKKYDTFGR